MTTTVAAVATDRIRRHSARARWLHTAVYATTLVLLGTGWWLTLGQEGRPSFLAEATGWSDAEIHTAAGWALAVVAVGGALIGRRGLRALVADSLRFAKGDLAWFRRWPSAVFTGRFGHHDGRFDPGQRIANLAMLVLLALLIASGVGLVLVSGGPVFVWLNLIHRWSTYLLTPLLLGHILIAAGVLPGYRGVWRSMHFGGRIKRSDAERVWPGWTRRGGRPQ
jgi:cytochrome b subunit of formate dehydrogenase